MEAMEKVNRVEARGKSLEGKGREGTGLPGNENAGRGGQPNRAKAKARG